MKEEMINAIAGETYRQNRLFQDQVVMKELKENGMLFDLYRNYKEKLFPRTDKQEFAAIYSHTVIFCNPPYSKHSLNKEISKMCNGNGYFPRKIFTCLLLVDRLNFIGNLSR
jgi:16S rRNA G966 N2-methylase RsmD